MKRTSEMLFVIFFEIVLVIAYFFLGNYFLMPLLFGINMILYGVLILEPDWRIGAFLTFATVSFVMVHSLNILVFRFLVFVSGIAALFLLILDFIAVFLAHKIRIGDEEYERDVSSVLNLSQDVVKKDLAENSVDNEIEISKQSSSIGDKDSSDEPSSNEGFETVIETKKPDVKGLFVFEGIVHLESCDDIKNISDESKTAVGSKRFAVLKKYKPCEKCKPY